MVRGQRVGQLDLLAAQEDLTLVGVVDAGEHLHQGGLAGPVFTDERMDFATTQGEVNAVQCSHAREHLADPLGLEDDLPGPGSRSAPGRGARCCHHQPPCCRSATASLSRRFRMRHRWEIVRFWCVILHPERPLRGLSGADMARFYKVRRRALCRRAAVSAWEAECLENHSSTR